MSRSLAARMPTNTASIGLTFRDGDGHSLSVVSPIEQRGLREQWAAAPIHLGRAAPLTIEIGISKKGLRNERSSSFRAPGGGKHRP